MYKSIFSLNVNGIKSAFENGLEQLIESHNPDVVCLQEIKSEFELPETFKHAYPYKYYKYGKSKGHHGVAIFSKSKADDCFSMNDDFEGRFIAVKFRDAYIFNVYAPSTSNTFNLPKKLLFLDKLIDLTKIYNKIVMVGDFNVAPTDSDMHEAKRKRVPAGGHFPEERAKYFEVVSTFTDIFDKIYNDEKLFTFFKFPSWVPENKGWRIDFIFVKNVKYSKSPEDTFVFVDSKISDHGSLVASVEI